MFTFTSQRQNHWIYILKHILIILVLFSIFPLVNFFYPTSYMKDIYYWVAAALFLVLTVDLLSKDRVYKLVIDEADASITQFYKSSMSGKGEKIILLDKVRIYVKKSSSAEGLLQSIQFYKGYRQVLKIDTRKDGFSSETLQQIGKTMADLGVRIADK